MDSQTNDNTATVELALEGMTCAACAARLEKGLNRMPGSLNNTNTISASS
jgi:Cu+-exporting ATPase